jgi:CheY-like chemotaxis protein
MVDHRTFSQRWADTITEFSGSWAFIGWFGLFCLIWVVLNISGIMSFDLYPFLLMNLGLTILSTFQSPLILLSQNRQNETDRETVQEMLKRLTELQASVDKLTQGNKQFQFHHHIIGGLMQFQFRHHNRFIYPQKHILVIEDTLDCQRGILDHFATVFNSQGITQFSVVPGALAASAIISSGLKIDIILLDHDLPEGNGTDFLNWMKEKALTIPVITFSGIPQNNTNMMALGATHLFDKGAVIRGEADAIIKGILGLPDDVLKAGQ